MMVHGWGRAALTQATHLAGERFLLGSAYGCCWLELAVRARKHDDVL